MRVSLALYVCWLDYSLALKLRVALAEGTKRCFGRGQADVELNTDTAHTLARHRTTRRVGARILVA